MSIRYLKGDATCPQAKGPKVIGHVCNDIGGWGKGFVLAISRRRIQPEAAYRRWHAGGRADGFRLGAMQLIQVEPWIHVANMVAQRGVKRGSGGPPIRYDALGECLSQLAPKARELEASVHLPRIGCGLAGGEWSRVEPLIEESPIAAGVQVFVYDFD
jgi:O-acetyl-ADP-ribose deacetylase (regulator of RNase III)